LKALGRQALFVRCDVTRDGDLRAAVEQALARFGRLDVVIANAGFGSADASSGCRSTTTAVCSTPMSSA
jgi:NAD(P)-dependent dehydrogenase (short-subunit alcohol dehydrogenase family)